MDVNDGKYDVVISICSYNRYDQLIRLIKDIKSQRSEYTYNLIIIDDFSLDKRYLDLINVFDNISVIRNSKNCGKELYWSTINTLLSEVKKYRPKYYIQLDDDFLICDKFLDKSINLFENSKKQYPNLGAISLHLSNEKDFNGNRWGLGNRWVDGGTIYSIGALSKLDFMVKPIPKNRWDGPNAKLSSGVWYQISSRLYNLNILCLKPSFSLLKHEDNNESMMNEEIRVKNPINTYKFVDDYETKEITTIAPNNNNNNVVKKNDIKLNNTIPRKKTKNNNNNHNNEINKALQIKKEKIINKRNRNMTYIPKSIKKITLGRNKK